MASIAIMIGGAVLNATTFIGESCLAKYRGGGDSGLAERTRHDKALEKYQKDYQKYESPTAFEQWKEAQAKRDENSRQYFANTDEALK